MILWFCLFFLGSQVGSRWQHVTKFVTHVTSRLWHVCRVTYVQLIRQSWLVLSQQIVHMSVPLCWSSEVWFSQLKTEYYNKSGWTEVKWAKVKQVESRWGQRDFPIIDFGDPLRSAIIVHSQETGSTLWLACYQNGRSDLPMYCRSAFYFRASVFHRALNCGILPPALARGSEGWLGGGCTDK